MDAMSHTPGWPWIESLVLPGNVCRALNLRYPFAPFRAKNCPRCTCSERPPGALALRRAVASSILPWPHQHAVASSYHSSSDPGDVGALPTSLSWIPSPAAWWSRVTVSFSCSCFVFPGMCACRVLGRRAPGGDRVAAGGVMGTSASSKLASCSAL